MRRVWIVIAAGLGAIIGGLLGWSVTLVGCRPDSCYISAGLVALVAAAVAAAGVGLVMILVVRSLDEWRAAEAVGREPPGVGCEVPDVTTDGDTT